MTQNQTEILRLNAVEQKTGLRKSSIYAAIKRGEFPGQVKLLGRASGWRRDEVEAWINSRPKAD